MLGEFLAVWVSFERMIAQLSKLNAVKLTTLGGRTRPPLMAMGEMVRVGVFESAEAKEIEELRRIRNEVVHGMVDYKTVVNRKVIQRLEKITEKYQHVLDSSPPPA